MDGRTSRTSSSLPTSRARAAELAYLASDTLEEVIGAAQRGIDRVRRTPNLPYSFLGHSGLDL